MKYEIPSSYEKAFSEADIAQGIQKITPAISEWVSDQNVVAVCLLRGGIFFFADLVRAVPQSLELEFAQISTYDASTNSKKEGICLETIGLPFDCVDKRILLIDDICDTGVLLRDLTASLQEKGAKEVKSAVMIHRDTPQSVFTPDFVALSLSTEEWLVGMGLDDKKQWRNIPYVCKIVTE